MKAMRNERLHLRLFGDGFIRRFCCFKVKVYCSLSRFVCSSRSNRQKKQPRIDEQPQ